MIFEPNWASPPGDTISRLAAASNLSTHELAERIGFEEDVFIGVMEGRVRICDEIADALSDLLGASRQFWINRYDQFVTDKARIEQPKADVSFAEWARDFPVKSLREMGWLPNGSRGEQLTSDILSFFGCKSISQWNERYSTGIGQVAFRTSFSYEEDEMATLAWLRAGELYSERLGLGKFSAKRFQNVLPSLKILCAYKRPEVFFPKLQAACAEHGIALVSSRAPKGCRASGATWTNHNGSPVILMSFRYLSEDHFWFTFFHEAAHVVLHGTDHISLEGVDPSPMASGQIEDEADMFAQEVLLPNALRQDLSTRRPTRPFVRKVARQAGVTPGIVVGQMQKLGMLQPSQFNDLKRRYSWQNNTLLPKMAQPRK
ncbi:ImmA/IrrE family metallo-endopeptidase [Thalassospira sp. MA62]|nr:ImmA/IrrE family metallo-endopeptidase [Thalassospira sp. MA62]